MTVVDGWSIYSNVVILVVIVVLLSPAHRVVVV